MVVKFSI